jgi:hypothetical protein
MSASYYQQLDGFVIEIPDPKNIYGSFITFNLLPFLVAL